MRYSPHLSFDQMPTVFKRISCLPALLAILGGMAGQPGMASQTMAIKMAGQNVTLEVARSMHEQRQGLMFRSRLDANAGMIFFFDPPRRVAMWMKNTLIDLDAAFVDSCGRILNIESMQAMSLDLHHSRTVAYSVIEMNAGWFSRHGLKVHDRIDALINPKHCPSEIHTGPLGLHTRNQ